MIPASNVLAERKIICIGYKFEGDKTVKSVQWEGMDDKKLLESFIPILESSSEVVGHNSSRFDLPWIRTRAAYHKLPISPYLTEVDTLRMARRAFKFNSNKLSYISEFLGVGGKLKTDFNLWREVMLGDEKALARMVRYCKNDVAITEKVYQALEAYGPYRTHVGVLSGGEKRDCVRCASKNTQKRGQRVSASGIRSQLMSCNECGRHFSISATEGAKIG